MLLPAISLSNGGRLDWTDNTISDKAAVLNLSGTSLTNEQTQVLALGLSFVPSPNYDAFKIKVALYQFFRKLHTSLFFQDKVLSRTDDSVCYNLSTWSPPVSNDASLITFQNLVLRDLGRLEESSSLNQFSNLTSRLRGALRDLQDATHLTIRRVDKGGAVVVQDTIKYHATVLAHLNNPKYYQVLTRDPGPQLQFKIKEYTTLAAQRAWITTKELSFLNPKHPKMPVLYMVPKVHKSLVDPPGCPIVSCRASVLEPLSIFCDHFFQPMTVHIKSHIRDS